MRALAHTEVVSDDSVIGLHMLGDFGWLPPPVDLVSRESLWHGSSLVIPPPSGNRIDVPADAASAELAGLLGGPFDEDLTPFIRTLTDVVFRNPDHQLPSRRERVFHDRPGVRYACLGAAFDRWRTQAIGAPDDFFFVSLFTTLDKGSALEPDDHPLPHPLGDPWQVVTRLAPALADRGLRPDTRYTNNLYDAVFVADRLRVRTGVRRAHDSTGNHTGEFLYVVRVDTRR